MTPDYERALIVGAGAGLSASLARLFRAEGLEVTLASRDISDLAELSVELDALAIPCDAASADDVRSLFEAMDETGAPDVVVYNPSRRVMGPTIDTDPQAVREAVEVTALGAYYVAREAALRMVPAQKGAILFTGASAGVKGYPRSATFAMGKFALRGLAQSLAREMHPQGVHIGHFVIDGGIRNPLRPERVEGSENPDRFLCPDAIARTYWHFLEQDRSCWSWEIEVRPWVETF